MVQQVFDIDFRGDAFIFPTETSPDHIRAIMRKSGNFYEKRLLEFLCSRMDGATWVIDCGANIGNHTIFMAGVLQRHVVAFEPIPSNLDALRAAVALNGLSHSVTVEPYAVSDTVGQVTLGMEFAGNPGSFSIGSGDQSHTVLAVTLDGHFQKAVPSGRLGILKVDVEGHEEHVLRGAMALIQNHRPMVICEAGTMTAFERIEALLAPIGYHAARVFGRTPTVVFDRVERISSERDKIVEKIAHYVLQHEHAPAG